MSERVNDEEKQEILHCICTTVEVIMRYVVATEKLMIEMR